MAEKKKISKRTKKKIAKSIFGKSLPIVMLIVALLGIAFYCAYSFVEPFHDFVDSIIVPVTTTAPEVTTPTNPPMSYIDPDGSELAVHFIDVGQGDSTLFQTAKGSVLVDCGKPQYGATVVEYLLTHGVTELEYFIITHPDDDHMGAAAYVLEHIEVKTVVMNGQQKNTNFFEETIDVLLDKQIDTVYVNQDDEIKLGGTITVGALQFKILGPQKLEYSTGETNNPSIILYATFGHRSFLLTGDAEKAAEKELVEKYGDIIDCDVFSAGHHGSNTSNTQVLLSAAKPEFVVISCGENTYGHPKEEIIERFKENGIEIYRTDMQGTVVFITDGESLDKVIGK